MASPCALRSRLARRSCARTPCTHRSTGASRGAASESAAAAAASEGGRSVRSHGRMATKLCGAASSSSAISDMADGASPRPPAPPRAPSSGDGWCGCSPPDGAPGARAACA
eukprot:scaffold132667_cov63-Phaeocystis_antarctica.AAC.2